MPIERVAVEPARLMPHAQRLKWRWSEHRPARCAAHAVGEPLRVGDVTSQARLEAGDALLPDQEPELQRTEAPSERHAPVAQVLDAAIRGRLQVAGVG